jgi:hypothetical protein
LQIQLGAATITVMSKFGEAIGRGLVISGSLGFVGSCSVDVATCPGEVEETSGEVFAVYCDEDPEVDHFGFRPGTPEQWLMLGSAAAVLAGTAILVIGRKQEEGIIVSDRA